METNAGLWIDHKKAIVVSISDGGEETALIISKAERQLRRTGDSPLQGPYEAHLVPEDDSRQKSYRGQLDIFYDAVIASVHGATSILIFGPGQAKDELKKRLEKKDLGGRIAGIETADKMTDRQFSAMVRKRFAG